MLWDYCEENANSVDGFFLTRKVTVISREPATKLGPIEFVPEMASPDYPATRIDKLPKGMLHFLSPTGSHIGFGTLVERGGRRFVATALHVANAASADGNFYVARAGDNTRVFVWEKPKRFLQLDCVDYVAFYPPENLGSVLGIKAALAASPVECSPIRVVSYGKDGYSMSMAPVTRPTKSELPTHSGAEIFRLKYSASTSFGSSGSGLFDAMGRCVGVHNGTMGSPHGMTVNLGTMLLLTDFRREAGLETNPQKGIMYNAIALAAQAQFEELYGMNVALMGMSEDKEDWYTITAYLEDELVELSYNSQQHVLASGFKYRETKKQRKHGRNTDRSGVRALRGENAEPSGAAEGPLNSSAPVKSPLEQAEGRARSALCETPSCSGASNPGSGVLASQTSEASSSSAASTPCDQIQPGEKSGGSPQPLPLSPSCKDMECQTSPLPLSSGPSSSRPAGEGKRRRRRKKSKKKLSPTSSASTLPTVPE